MLEYDVSVKELVYSEIHLHHYPSSWESAHLHEHPKLGLKELSAPEIYARIRVLT
jgi:hypothetical protein